MAYNHKERLISDYLFINKVYPQICLKTSILKGTLINTYDWSHIKGFLEFDKKNGIDFFIFGQRPMFGLGTRTQSDCEYRSFTITCWKKDSDHTALKNLRASIKAGCYPQYTIQAYTTSNSKLSIEDEISEIGVIETLEFLQILDSKEYRNKRHSNMKGSEKFYYFEFSDLAKIAKSLVHIKL